MRLASRLSFLMAVFMYVAAASAAVTVSVNGSSHTIPQTGEKGWGTNVTAWIQAISANTLQPNGGNFTLTADTNFGGNYGLIAPYYKSRATNLSTSGAIRIGTTEAIGWRNNANDGNLLLNVDSSDRLLFNGALLPSLSSSDFTDTGFRVVDDGDSTKKIALQASGITTGTTRTLTVPDASGTLTLNDSTGTLTNKTISGSSNTFSNIPYGALSLGSSIVNSDISASAGIGTTKLEALTASRVAITNASGYLSAADTATYPSLTELSYVKGVTSAVQTQVDAKVPKSAFTAKGDLVIGSTANTYVTKSIGSDGQFLKADSASGGGVTWASPSGAALSVTSKTTTYTATTSDDVILASGSAFTITLYAASGNGGKVLRIKKTDASLTNIITIDGNSSETIDGATTTTLNTQYEEVTLLCDGSNWHILSRTYPQVWVAYTPTLTGFGTPSGVSFYSRRVGDSLEVQGTFTSGTSTATQARATLGFNGTNANVTSAGTSKITSGGHVVGSGFYNAANAVSLVLLATPGVGHMLFGLQSAGTAGYAAQNGDGLAGSGQAVSFYARIPIEGWN
jgi:hypothetical protein